MERKNLLTSLQHHFWYSLPFFLYAETHYRFRYFLSYLKKPEPEIIADAPHRIDPGKSLPVLVLAKDADRYPCTLTGVKIRILQKQHLLFERELLEAPVPLQASVWWRVFHIEIPTTKGWSDCDVKMTIEQSGRTKSYHNDNHRTSSRRPLRIYVSEEPLPRFAHLHLGEAHSHSSYTNDQVEFGSPLPASIELCKSMGLSFFCVTDHSYDLDDRVDDYLVNDHSLPHWRALQKDVDVLNSQHEDFAVVRGEEVTCRNRKGRNIHFLLLGNKEFHHGSGDSAERWLQTRSRHSVEEILRAMEPSALAFAAHAQEPVPFLQRLLLGRGNWSENDLEDERLTGIQFANGKLDAGFQEGYRSWIRLLLKGKRVIAIAGNDAHGNFNRFRQVGIPFLKIREADTQIFGKHRTGVFVENVSEHLILRAIDEGKCIITDGPVANIVVGDDKSVTSSMGQKLKGGEFQITLAVASNKEFGSLQDVKLIAGKIGSSQEVELFRNQLSPEFALEHEMSLKIESSSYIRAEVVTDNLNSADGENHFCITNPVWLNPHR